MQWTILTRFLMPSCCRMERRARRKWAMLAIVSADKHLSSLFGSRRIFTIVLRAPRSVIVRRIEAFFVISLRIFRAPICGSKLIEYKSIRLHGRYRRAGYYCSNRRAKLLWLVVHLAKRRLRSGMLAFDNYCTSWSRDSSAPTSRRSLCDIM